MDEKFHFFCVLKVILSEYDKFVSNVSNIVIYCMAYDMFQFPYGKESSLQNGKLCRPFMISQTQNKLNISLIFYCIFFFV